MSSCPRCRASTRPGRSGPSPKPPRSRSSSSPRSRSAATTRRPWRPAPGGTSPSRSAPDPKHTPRIVAQDTVKRGQWFDVTVSVGAGGDHPSLGEHFVRYIALYLNTAEIARVYLHPVHSFPRVTFTIALDEGGMLRAIAEPTHSAGWEASKKITVVP